MEDENYSANQEVVTKFKDIDEGFRFKIIEFLGNAYKYRSDGDYIKAFKWIRSVFEIIQPASFKHKELLMGYTLKINEYLNELGIKPTDMRHRLELDGKEFELKELIDDYFNLIPHCLEELGLYLKFLKRRDDPDEQFSEETFNTNKSLLEGKKKLLKQLSSSDLLNYMSARNIHDVHARILIDINLRKDKGEIENG
jgi:hypothetical protein